MGQVCDLIRKDSSRRISNEPSIEEDVVDEIPDRQPEATAQDDREIQDDRQADDDQRSESAENAREMLEDQGPPTAEIPDQQPEATTQDDRKILDDHQPDDDRKIVSKENEREMPEDQGAPTVTTAEDQQTKADEDLGERKCEKEATSKNELEISEDQATPTAATEEDQPTKAAEDQGEKKGDKEATSASISGPTEKKRVTFALGTAKGSEPKERNTLKGLAGLLAATDTVENEFHFEGYELADEGDGEKGNQQPRVLNEYELMNYYYTEGEVPNDLAERPFIISTVPKAAGDGSGNKSAKATTAAKPEGEESLSLTSISTVTGYSELTGSGKNTGFMGYFSHLVETFQDNLPRITSQAASNHPVHVKRRSDTEDGSNGAIPDPTTESYKLGYRLADACLGGGGNDPTSLPGIPEEPTGLTAKQVRFREEDSIINPPPSWTGWTRYINGDIAKILNKISGLSKPFDRAALYRGFAQRISEKLVSIDDEGSSSAEKTAATGKVLVRAIKLLRFLRKLEVELAGSLDPNQTDFMGLEWNDWAFCSRDEDEEYEPSTQPVTATTGVEGALFSLGEKELSELPVRVTLFSGKHPKNRSRMTRKILRNNRRKVKRMRSAPTQRYTGWESEEEESSIMDYGSSIASSVTTDTASRPGIDKASLKKLYEELNDDSESVMTSDLQSLDATDVESIVEFLTREGDDMPRLRSPTAGRTADLAGKQKSSSHGLNPPEAVRTEDDSSSSSSSRSSLTWERWHGKELSETERTIKRLKAAITTGQVPSDGSESSRSKSTATWTNSRGSNLSRSRSETRPSRFADNGRDKGGSRGRFDTGPSISRGANRKTKAKTTTKKKNTQASSAMFEGLLDFDPDDGAISKSRSISKFTDSQAAQYSARDAADDGGDDLSSQQSCSSESVPVMPSRRDYEALLKASS